MLLLFGNEPDHAWLAFSEQVVDLAVDLGARMVLGLGAYPTPVPHTRTPLLAASASSEELAQGLLQNSVEVPSGVQGMIERRAALRGLPALGLWAQVPHYVSAMPYPAASLALLQGANRVAGLDLPLGDLPERADASRRRIDELIAQNPEHTAMLEQLEAQADQQASNTALPGHQRRRAGRRARALPPRAVSRPLDRPVKPGLGSAAMKVDGGIGGGLGGGTAGAGARPRCRRSRATTGSGRRRRPTTRSSRCSSRRRRTERVELGTGIAVAFARNPMNLAQIAWDLQAASEGRFILGLGSQIKPHITKRFSMPWSHPAARMREMILAIRAIWACWNDGTKLDFQGDFYTHTLMTPFFNPGPNPHGDAKISLAGVGELMTEVAGEVCDGFLCHGFTTERYLREVTLPALERGAAKAGRTLADIEISGPAFVVTGTNEEEMARSAAGTKQQIAFYGSTPAYRGVLELHGWGGLQDDLNKMSKEGKWKEMGELITDEILHTFAVVAEPEKLAAGPRGALRRHRPAPQLLRALRQRPRPLARGDGAAQGGLTRRGAPPGGADPCADTDH